MLRRIFGSRRDEVKGEWRKLHIEELKDMYCSPNIVWVIKSRRIRWAGNVPHMGRREVYTGFWWGNLRGKDNLEDPSVDGRIILRWIFRMWDVGHGLNRCGSEQGQVAGTCECGKEPSGSIKCGEFPE